MAQEASPRIVKARPLAPDEPDGPRPYEMVRAGRRAEQKPLVSFDSLEGWTLECRNGAAGELAVSKRQRLWESAVARLVYRGTSRESTLTLRPPSPLPIPGPVSAASIWIHGNNWGWSPEPGTPQVTVSLLLQDRGGNSHPLQITRVRWKEWWLVHKVLPRALVDNAPLELAGIEIRGGANAENRELYFEDLAFFEESLPPLAFAARPKRGVDPFPGQSPGAHRGPGRLPFPTREETILPENGVEGFETTLRPAGSGSAYRFVYQGPDVLLEYAITPEQVGWGPVLVKVGGQPVAKALVDAGPVFGEASGDLRLAEVEAEGDVLRGVWTGKLGEDEVLVESRLRLWQKSLVVDYICRGGSATELSYGRIVDVAEPELILLPYLNYGGRELHVLMSKGSRPFFASVWMDWYRSGASVPYAEDKIQGDAVRLNGGVRYHPRTDGRRNDLYERVFVTFSPAFEEVLPTIPHPPAKRGREAGTRLWQESWGPRDYEKEHERSRRLRAYGIEMLTQCNHEITWRDGGESFTFRTAAAPGKGGDEALKRYVEAQRSLGWRSGLYTNYCDFSPVNEYWDVNQVMRRSTGDLITAWPRCYSPKALFAVEMDRKLAPLIQAKFNTNAAYTDVHTAVAPWDRTDYDARVPGAGTFAATFYAYGELLLHDQEVYDGHCWSEGNHQWLYAGLATGNYGLTYSGLRLWEVPYLPHFDLLKMHPLSVDIGVPWTSRFFHGKEGWNKPERIVPSIDQFIAATIAYGHIGWLVEESHGIRQTCRSYYMLQQLQSRYALVRPVEIRYGTDRGVVSSSEALLSGEWKKSRLFVRYANSLKVWVNGNSREPWRVREGGVTHVLPPYGWLAVQPDAFFECSELRDGTRFDGVSSSGYVFLDGRGHFRTLDGVGAAGSLAVRASREGEGLSVTVIEGVEELALTAPGEKFKGLDDDDVRTRIGRVADSERLTVTAYDQDGKSLGSVAGSRIPSGWKISARDGARRYEIRAVAAASRDGRQGEASPRGGRRARSRQGQTNGLNRRSVGPVPLDPLRQLAEFNFRAVREAIEDLSGTFGPVYPDGRRWLEQLKALEIEAGGARENRRKAVHILGRLQTLRHQALLTSNPVLDFDQLIVLKRKRGQHGLPVNHKCNSGIEPSGYDNEIAVLSPVRQGGKLTTLFGPEGGWFVGEIDLHFDADRLLFTMPNGRTWQIHEIRVDATGLRQVSREEPGVDHFDGAYLPDGGIVFSSTASFHAVPCWHGRERACTIYRMDSDGSNVRQLCFDQDLDLHPSVLPTGQIIFNRWDYTGPLHMYLAPVMVMNPDGTGQKALYGSNSYWPNRLYFPRGIPGDPARIVAIAAGYHGPPRMGVPVMIDTRLGWHGTDGLVQFIPGRDKSFDGSVKVDTWYDKVWPKYLHPYPLAESETRRGAGKYFLVAMQPTRKSTWGIYLIDVFDNVVPVLVDRRWDFFEPIPLRKSSKPPVIPDRVDRTRDDAVMYVHDVYRGPGLTDVPRGSIKRLRVVAYHFGYPGMAGPDKVGLGGPWEAMRILGTVPVEPDGSAAFRVPANTPLSLQPLDAEGKAVQLMRSWTTAMPGESVACVGCHEEPKDTPVVRYDLAMGRAPDEIEPWYGPPRGFDFEREVQPVLDEYCTSCHDGTSPGDGGKMRDLRGERHHPDYGGHLLARLGAQRLDPAVEKYFGGKQVRYTPAYEALIPFVRRVGIEDDVNILVPGEYHADTSELVQMLRKGHHGVKLDREAWDRLVTWIDLNAPCHGTWGDVAPIPNGADRRRREIQRQCGGPSVDFEAVPDLSREPVRAVEPTPPRPRGTVPRVSGWPFDAVEARRRQQAAGSSIHRTIDLGGGVTMKLVRIPAGRFVMGNGDSHGGAEGEMDERPPAIVTIDRPFWLGAYEVTNAQYRRFDPEHRTGFFTKRYPGVDGPGLTLDAPEQPVIRVSWQQAMAFCRWLSQRSGMEVTLPTEAQWEYACRAGTATAMSYGAADADFSQHANVADRALAIRPPATGGLTSAIVNPYLDGKFSGIMLDSVFGGDIPCDVDYADAVAATAEVGRFEPNAWGLYDLHGNVAEWTLTTYRPYPYRDDDGRNCAFADGEKVVRGGSFRDRPHRCRSAFRLSYPAWQRVHNVGFRILVHDGPGHGTDG